MPVSYFPKEKIDGVMVQPRVRIDRDEYGLVIGIVRAYPPEVEERLQKLCKVCVSRDVNACPNAAIKNLGIMKRVVCTSEQAPNRKLANIYLNRTWENLSEITTCSEQNTEKIL